MTCLFSDLSSRTDVMWHDKQTSMNDVFLLQTKAYWTTGTPTPRMKVQRQPILSSDKAYVNGTQRPEAMNMSVTKKEIRDN